MPRMNAVAAAALTAMLAACALEARAQADPLAAIDKLSGEARMRALVEGAKKEGEVMVYHSTQAEDLKPVFDAFTAKYGVKVRDWRSSSENVVQRVIGEGRAKKREVDFIENNSPEMEALRRENLLRKMESPHFSDMRPGTLGAHHTYATTTVDIFVQAYNTEKVKKDELPKSFDDLADPKWRDRLGVEAEDFGWFGTLLNAMGHDKGLKLWREIVAKNGVSIRKGHTLLAQLVASGEVPMALTVYSYKPLQMKEKGGYIDSIILQPAVGQLHAVAVHAQASHPHAAALLYDFFLGEGQALLAKKSFLPSSAKVRSTLDSTPVKYIDPAEALDKQEAWRKEFDDLFLRKVTR